MEQTPAGVAPGKYFKSIPGTTSHRNFDLNVNKATLRIAIAHRLLIQFKLENFASETKPFASASAVVIGPGIAQVIEN